MRSSRTATWIAGGGRVARRLTLPGSDDDIKKDKNKVTKRSAKPENGYFIYMSLIVLKQ